MAGQSDLKQKKWILGEEWEIIKQACQTQNVIDNHGNLIDFRTIEGDAQEDEETWIQDLKNFYSGLKTACRKDEFSLKRLALSTNVSFLYCWTSESVQDCWMFYILYMALLSQNLTHSAFYVQQPNIKWFSKMWVTNCSSIEKKEADTMTKNQLITLSLTCLSACLEALQVYPACMRPSSHLFCIYEELCMVRCIQRLRNSIRFCLKELSVVKL